MAGWTALCFIVKRSTAQISTADRKIHGDVCVGFSVLTRESCDRKSNKAVTDSVHSVSISVFKNNSAMRRTAVKPTGRPPENVVVLKGKEPMSTERKTPV